MVKISIFEEDIQTRKCTIVKNSEEEHNFVIDIMNLIKDLNINHINSKDDLEVIIQNFVKNTNNIWFKYSKLVNITKCSNLWWNNNCQMALETYRNLELLNDWKNFKKIVKTSKHKFFNSKIQEILNKRKGLWELINWIKKRKLLAIEAIKYNSNLCLKIEDL